MTNLNNKTVVATEFLKKRKNIFEGRLNYFDLNKKKTGSLINATL